jgi:hypothetical protein
MKNRSPLDAVIVMPVAAVLIGYGLWFLLLAVLRTPDWLARLFPAQRYPSARNTPNTLKSNRRPQHNRRSMRRAVTDLHRMERSSASSITV